MIRLYVGLVFSFILGSSAAMSDSTRDVKASPITCIGSTAGKSIALTVMTVEKNATRIQIIGVGNKLTIDNPEQLRVGSEGNVYIQQVQNGSYNLYLSGSELADLLDGKDGQYRFKGSLDLFGEEEMGFKLLCLGNFVK